MSPAGAEPAEAAVVATPASGAGGAPRCARRAVPAGSVPAGSVPAGAVPAGSEVGGVVAEADEPAAAAMSATPASAIVVLRQWRLM